MGHGVDRRIPIRVLLGTAVEGAPVTTQGWIKTSRFSKNVSFVHLFDGSTPKTVQVVLTTPPDDALKARLQMHAAVEVRGVWAKSPGGEQAWEIKADPGDIEIIGDTDTEPYPIQKKRTSLEHLRTLQPMSLYAANAMFLADYLTEPGQTVEMDQQIIEDLGFEWEER